MELTEATSEDVRLWIHTDASESSPGSVGGRTRVSVPAATASEISRAAASSACSPASSIRAAPPQ